MSSKVTYTTYSIAPEQDGSGQGNMFEPKDVLDAVSLGCLDACNQWAESIETGTEFQESYSTMDATIGKTPSTAFDFLKQVTRAYGNDAYRDAILKVCPAAKAVYEFVQEHPNVLKGSTDGFFYSGDTNVKKLRGIVGFDGTTVKLTFVVPELKPGEYYDAPNAKARNVEEDVPKATAVNPTTCYLLGYWSPKNMAPYTGKFKKKLNGIEKDFNKRVFPSAYIYLAHFHERRTRSGVFKSVGLRGPSAKDGKTSGKIPDVRIACPGNASAILEQRFPGKGKSMAGAWRLTFRVHSIAKAIPACAKGDRDKEQFPVGAVLLEAMSKLAAKNKGKEVSDIITTWRSNIQGKIKKEDRDPITTTAVTEIWSLFEKTTFV